MATTKSGTEDSSVSRSASAERGAQPSAGQKGAERGAQQASAQSDTEARGQQGAGQQGGEWSAGWRAQQGNYRGGQAQGRQPSALNISAAALRGLGQFYDMQAATARVMMRAQMRAASVLGLPDYSGLFQINDDRASRLCSSATDNLLQLIGQADGPMTEVPSQVFHLLEQQAIEVTERMKSGLEELQYQASESMEELKQLTRQQASEVGRAPEMLMDATRESLRESGEEFRSAMRQGRDEIASHQAQAQHSNQNEGEDERASGKEQEKRYQAYQMQPEYRERRHQQGHQESLGRQARQHPSQGKSAHSSSFEAGSEGGGSSRQRPSASSGTSPGSGRAA